MSTVQERVLSTGVLSATSLDAEQEKRIMNRLTTDTPEGNFQTLMNFAYAKNGEVWLRGAGDDGEDVLLNEYISQLSKCNLVGCEIETEDVPEACAQGCFCHLGALFAAATQAAELRARLSAYEEIGLSPEEIDVFARQTSKIRMAAGCATLDDCYNLAKSGRLLVLPEERSYHENMNIGLIGLAPRRKQAGLTQENLAASLKVSRSLLAAWETGRTWPSSERLPDMAKLLHCSIEDLYVPPVDDSILQQEGVTVPCRQSAEISTQTPGELQV